MAKTGGPTEYRVLTLEVEDDSEPQVVTTYSNDEPEPFQRLSELPHSSSEVVTSSDTRGAAVPGPASRRYVDTRGAADSASLPRNFSGVPQPAHVARFVPAALERRRFQPLRRSSGRAPRQACNQRIRGSRRSRSGSRTRARSPDPEPPKPEHRGRHPRLRRRGVAMAAQSVGRRRPAPVPAGRRRPLEPRYEWRCWAAERHQALQRLVRDERNQIEFDLGEVA
jgi:hypothetical protein